jgi:hypothetical protein
MRHANLSTDGSSINEICWILPDSNIYLARLNSFIEDITSSRLPNAQQ